MCIIIIVIFISLKLHRVIIIHAYQFKTSLPKYQLKTHLVGLNCAKLNGIANKTKPTTGYNKNSVRSKNGKELNPTNWQ